MSQAAVKLYGYQQRWLLDQSRFKIVVKARQTGFSFALALESSLDAVESGQLWVHLSAGERQSKELMEKVHMHLKAIKAGIISLDEDFFQDTECRQLSIKLDNGGRLIGLPANPATARGFSGNIILDEFAFHRDSRQIWTALYPTITRGFKLRVGSTPQGRNNQYYSLWSGANNFSKHHVNIYEAVADGLPISIEELRAGIDDPDAWAQEYECQFLDEAGSLLTYELIAGCESDKATEAYEPPPGAAGPREYYLGVDIGRKRDLTVLWLLEKVGDVYWTRAVEVMEKAPFADQLKQIDGWMQALRIRRCCIDATGMGMPLAEFLGVRHHSAAEGVTFTAKVKEDLAMRMLRIFQDKQVRIPVSTKIRQDLHSVAKTTTAAGNIRFDAERSENGHADRFWALGLALMASSEGTVKPEFIWL